MRNVIVCVSLAIASAALALPAKAAVTASAPAPAPARAKMNFWFLDRNVDGFIDVTEIEAVRTARFHAMDQDGDGKLTKAEAIAAIESERWKHKGGKNEAADARSNDRSERFAKREAAALKRFGFSDTAETVTLAEFLAIETPMLKRADKDGDGKISEAEFLAMRSQPGHGMSAD